MSDWETIETIGVPTAPQAPEQYKTTEIYKEWFVTRNAAGFISIVPYLTNDKKEFVNKVGIEIGKVGKDNKVESSTQCWVDAIKLACFLRMVTYHPDRASAIYPKRQGTYSPRSFITFGGKGDIARVFKIEQWGSSAESEGTADSYAWKTAHFGGTVQGTGAIRPNYKDPRSVDMIKRTSEQMLEMSYRLDNAIAAVSNKLYNE